MAAKKEVKKKAKSKANAKKASQITFKYIFSDDYNPAFANGVYGGVNSSGQIVANFYFERHALPNAVIHQITSQGTLGKEIERIPKDHPTSMVRFVKSGVVLDMAGAKVICEWLRRQIVAAEEAQTAIRTIRSSKRSKKK